MGEGEGKRIVRVRECYIYGCVFEFLKVSLFPIFRRKIGKQIRKSHGNMKRDALRAEAGKRAAVFGRG